jgi:hypothetical protein
MPQRRNSINKCPFASTWYNSVWTTSVQGQRWCADDDDAGDTKAPVVWVPSADTLFSLERRVTTVSQQRSGLSSPVATTNCDLPRSFLTHLRCHGESTAMYSRLVPVRS